MDPRGIWIDWVDSEQLPDVSAQAEHTEQERLILTGASHTSLLSAPSALEPAHRGQERMQDGHAQAAEPQSHSDDCWVAAALAIAGSSSQRGLSQNCTFGRGRV